MKTKEKKVNNLRKLIRNKYKKYATSNHNVDDSDVDFIIKHNCRCDDCGESIFNMYDFPEILHENEEHNEELLCEECYNESYRDICAICEESYDTYDGASEYKVITKEEAESDEIPGIYKHEGYCNGLKLVIPIDINQYKRIYCGDECCEVESGYICPDCVEKLIRNNNFIKIDNGIPCILMKKYENDEIFKEYSKDKLHRERQRIIHQRITCRGIIQQANKKRELV